MRGQNIGQTLEDEIVQWAHQLQWENIPTEVRKAAVNGVVDGWGVAIAGGETEVYKQITAAVSGLYGSDKGACSVIGTTVRESMVAATWLNAAAMHILDFDDTSFVGILHPTTVVLPAVWAYAEEHGENYQSVLLAYIVGVEAMLALAAMYGDQLYIKGHWTTSTLGAVGAAVAVAKLMNLPPSGIYQSISLALQMTSAMRSVHGTNAKPFFAGVAAKRGIEAAISASVGIEAGQGSLCGVYGHLNVNACKPLENEQRLGSPYRLLEPGIFFKLYPLCSATQAAICALLKLQETHFFTAQDIDAINCWGTELVVTCLSYQLPTSMSEAQFSMPFALATIALCGELSLDHLQAEWWETEEFVNMASKVHLTTDSSLVDTADHVKYPEAARVEVHLKDGRILEHTELAAQGMPVWPLSQAQIKQKFMSLVKHKLKLHTAQDLYQQLANPKENQLIADFVLGYGDD